MLVKRGFVTALGTPLDENGHVVEASYRKEVEDQIQAGAGGLLCMGSMGIQAFINPHECPKVAAIAVDQAAGRVPVFVGAMSCSIEGALARIKSMENVNADAFVFTTPYYNPVKKPQIERFFTEIAKHTEKNIMAYDLPSVTQSKITYEIVKDIKAQCPNFVGIKTNDTALIRKIKTCGEMPADFMTCYSGLDIFDVCYPFGLDVYLDGMIACCPKNFTKIDRALVTGDMKTAGDCLNKVLKLRDAMASYPYLLAAFTEAMNLLGYEGRFHPDYAAFEGNACREHMRKLLAEIGEL